MTVFQFNKYVVSPVLYSNYVNYVNYVNLDILWLVSFNSSSTVSLWTSWNTKRCDKDLPQQTVAYMKPITLPPIRTDVVRETLNRSNAVTDECGFKFTIVSYDLAIAEISKQIQCTDYPEFENVFIQFGQFHTEANVFSSLGKLIEDSGGPYLLMEANVVAVGSMKRFFERENV